MEVEVWIDEEYVDRPSESSTQKPKETLDDGNVQGNI